MIYACDTCGRRHGESPLIAPLRPLAFGEPVPTWCWLDEHPSELIVKHALRTLPGYQEGAPVWRDWCGVVSWAPAKTLPRQREEVRLQRYEPEDVEYDDFCVCPLCEQFYEEVEAVIAPLPDVRTVAAAQLRLAVA